MVILNGFLVQIGAERQQSPIPIDRMFCLECWVALELSMKLCL